MLAYQRVGEDENHAVVVVCKALDVFLLWTKAQTEAETECQAGDHAYDQDESGLFVDG